MLVFRSTKILGLVISSSKYEHLCTFDLRKMFARTIPIIFMYINVYAFLLLNLNPMIFTINLKYCKYLYKNFVLYIYFRCGGESNYWQVDIQMKNETLGDRSA